MTNPFSLPYLKLPLRIHSVGFFFMFPKIRFTSILLFWRVRSSRKKRLLSSTLPSARPYVIPTYVICMYQAGFHSTDFRKKFISETFIKICGTNPDLVKSGQKCRAVYKETCIPLHFWQQYAIFCTRQQCKGNPLLTFHAILNSYAILTAACSLRLRFHGNPFSILYCRVTCSSTIHRSHCCVKWQCLRERATI
jgi:hypothetical protein